MDLVEPVRGLEFAEMLELVVRLDRVGIFKLGDLVKSAESPYLKRSRGSESANLVTDFCNEVRVILSNDVVACLDEEADSLSVEVTKASLDDRAVALLLEGVMLSVDNSVFMDRRSDVSGRLPGLQHSEELLVEESESKRVDAPNGVLDNDGEAGLEDLLIDVLPEKDEVELGNVSVDEALVERQSSLWGFDDR